MKRLSIEVDGVPTSYLSAGVEGPIVLLLHGTYWSRVWQPVLEDLAQAGFRPVAVDLPGFGRSSGALTPAEATVPALADWTVRFVAALGEAGKSVLLGGHDIGGGIAQHLFATDALDIPRLLLMNAVMYDSWPAPTVLRFRDPAVAADTSPADILAARRQSLVTALARPADEAEIQEWLNPWTDPRVARSWLSMAISADHRYTTALVPALKASPKPKLLIWGEDDGFQKVIYAERFLAEIPNTRLVRIPNAGHIPTANDAPGIAREMVHFFAD
ncbi:MAG: alpha/beta hydrolase [Bradyrhizobium sp.]|nr:alpha/beta hydrolase [Bradyrhizobium sp.]